MRSTSSRLLFVLVFLLVGAGAWFAVYLNSSGKEERAAGPGAAVVLNPADDAPLHSPDALLHGETDVAEVSVGPAREALAGEADTAVSPLHVLRGRVQWPEGTPRDELAVVLAARESVELRDLYDDDDGLADLARLGVAEELPDELLAVAAVDPQGRFELPLLEHVHEVHLAVSGRYLYQTATVRVAVPSEEEAVLTPELGGWLVGRLESPPGADPTEAEVELGPDLGGGFDPMGMSRRATGREASADEQGRFEFGGVLTVDRQQLFARHPELAALPLDGIALEPGERRDITLELTPGATLGGRVVDDRGAPVEDADVSVRVRGLAGRMLRDLRSVETDAEGRFELLGVLPGKLVLEASSHGYLDAEERLEGPVEEGETRTGLELLLDRGGRIAGIVVLPGGDPVENARVVASPDPTGVDNASFFLAGFGLDSSSARTDAQGRFTISGLGDGLHQVSAKFSGRSEVPFGDFPELDELLGDIGAGVSAPPGDPFSDATDPGHAPREVGDMLSELRAAGPVEWSVEQDGVRPGTLDLRLELSALESLLGLVVDTDGAPVTAFRVQAERVGSGGMFGMGADVEETSVNDVAGRFSLSGLRPDRWEVSATAAGFGDSQPLQVDVPREPGAAPLLITLEPAAAAGGVVLDTAGRPVAGARVAPEMSLQEMLSSRGADQPEAITDREGRFLLEGLDPGSVALGAELEGFAPSESLGLELGAGERVLDLVLSLRVGATLTGEVLDAEGEPDSTRMVTVQSIPTYVRQEFVQTDGDGRFRLEHLAPGRYQVVVTGNFFDSDSELLEAEDGDSQEAMESLLSGMEIEFVDLVDGEELHVVLGQPPANPVHLTVAVEHDGQPVEGVMVVMMPGDMSQGGMGSMDMKLTDEEGRFETQLDQAGGWLVTVQGQTGIGRQNSVEFPIQIPEGVEAHELVLELPMGRISGTVRGPDGEPVQGARVTLNVEGGNTFGSFLGGQYAEVQTGADGTYDLPWLGAGSYTVGAGGAAMGGMFGGGAALGRSQRSGVAVGEGEWVAGVDFNLQEPGGIEGIVRDAGGAPVAEASIFVRDEDGAVLERFSLFSTGADGRFRYEGVAPGRYTVEVRAADGAGRSPLLDVLAGEDVQTEVRLEGSTLLRISVVDKSDADVSARVSVTDEQGHEHNGLMSMTAIMSAFGEGYSSSEQVVGPLAPGRYLVRAVTQDGRQTSKPVVVGGRAERKVRLRLK